MGKCEFLVKCWSHCHCSAPTYVLGLRNVVLPQWSTFAEKMNKINMDGNVHNCFIWNQSMVKRTLDNFSLIPNFFLKSWYFYTIRIYLCSDCMLSLTCKDTLIYLAAAIFKSLLLKMGATVMTVEFGTIHHSGKKIWSLFKQFFEHIQKLTEHYVNYDILV